ncbi:MAG TPA: tetraacyldisaccharide 4'-kinase [Azospirillaceae bacterium]|nr:tetraacyldisaccharide 4'-kinase [Azospirillaceae bacterium]
MKAPAFWTTPPGLAATLLSPAAAAFAWAGRRRRRQIPRRAPVPVLCVGNLVAGGAGKTPVARSIVLALRRAGVDCHVLIRGHGGRLSGPLRVEPERHTARDVGDEALLHAGTGPTWVSRDRAAGAAAAAAAGADILVMDDGFQNPQPAKDLSLVVVDGETGFGNGRVIPAGPLREPVNEGLARADAVVVIGTDRAGVRERVAAHRPDLPVLEAHLVHPPAAAWVRGVRLFAFAGIGRPGKFFASLRDLGAEVVGTAAFPDHHVYNEDEVFRLVERAQALRAELVTTEKDAVRLPSSARTMVRVVPVGLHWPDPGAVRRLVLPLLGPPQDPVSADMQAFDGQAFDF